MSEECGKRIYRVFCRAWWQENPSWPNGLEPDSRASKQYLRGRFTLAEARAKCAQLNAEPRTPRQERLGFKWEFNS
jgi:hypothetical protein